jgi:bifunctional UDP-N-acetylglucosamine pyrophosphorylase/glucosamine-1-phosphate N-acetyltransferase
MGRTVIEHLLESLKTLRANDTRVVVGHQAEAVEPLLAPYGATAVLQVPQLGTGHALMACRKALESGGPGEILLVAGDVPLLPVDEVARRWDAAHEGRAPAAVFTLELENPTGYGRVVRDSTGALARVVEEKDASPTEKAGREVNSGVYFFRVPEIFSLLERVGNANAQGEYYLTDVFALLHGHGEPAAIYPVAQPERWLGINSQADLARATRLLRGEILDRWMAEGVTVMDPESTWVEPAVAMEPGVVLHPFVRLCGACRLEAGAEVHAFSVLHGTSLGRGTLVKESCVLEGTTAGSGCIIGPFCHTREGTVLEDRVHLGNFVETKKARLGRGVKANHLTYLGDATVGAGSNVGAGTITCNYDGVKKHPTTLGEGVFVGSDTQLVAPVSVGDGAYIGAGTTVTKDVPAGALAISRPPQRNVEGWADKRRKQRNREPGKQS